MMVFSSRSLMAAAACAGLLSSASAQAAGAQGRQFFGLGAGGGMIANGQPCPDLQCNGTDVCSCVTSSGTINLSTAKTSFPSGTYTLELSADKSTAMPNGAGGLCYGTAGNMVVTTSVGTLTLNVAGLSCRVGQGGGGPESVPFAITAPAVIVSGTGGYKNPLGTGSLSASFDPMSKTALLDLVGYGNLVNPTPPPPPAE